MVPHEPSPRLTRRRFLRHVTGWGALAGIVGLPLYCWRIEPHWIEIVHRDMPIAHLPDRLVGRTLVQISDLHIGPVVDEDYITSAMERVSALEPDIVAITGDFMTCHGNEQISKVVEVLSHLDHGRLATVAILGNHDYGASWSRVAVADELADKLGGLGIKVLRNERTEVGGLTIVGLDDMWSPRWEPEKVMPTLAPEKAALVLCHNPDAVDRPMWSGYQGWILSGHTHGGQCKPPFCTPPLLPINNHRYHAGEIDLGDGRRLYVNRALGYLRRVRFNARPEVTVFTLRREGSSIGVSS
jgi:predicted MPP superfamily phosphohydrolase